MSEIAIFLAQITDPIRIAMACLVGYMVAKTRWSSIAWPLAVTATFAIVIAYSVPRLMWAFLLGKAMQNNRIDKLFNPFQEPTLAELPNYGWDLFTQVFNRETFDEVKSLVEQRYHDCSVLWGRSGRTGDDLLSLCDNYSTIIGIASALTLIGASAALTWFIRRRRLASN